MRNDCLVILAGSAVACWPLFRSFLGLFFVFVSFLKKGWNSKVLLKYLG